jgi:colanic acid/amylovoran biosynthesis glycosyltransferase
VLTVAYLANQFPSPVEPYVGDEIAELRRRGICVVTGSVRKSQAADLDARARAEVILHPVSPIVLLQAVWLCLRRWRRISPLLLRVIFRGREGPVLRAKALLHTWLGACYAVRLEAREVEHIHVHHGYFGSWIAMVASRLLGVGFSMTLHGSDLLLHGAYLDVKIESCTFCRTVSEYNREFILKHYPAVEPEKIVVSRLGVEVGSRPRSFSSKPERHASGLMMLAVGRLHAVKDHAFLVQACAELYQRGVEFECADGGNGARQDRTGSGHHRNS